ncbi:sigma-70 family RNA polymerase sigma factor [Jeotgalibacillus sp. ET6]|uniref:sigma-70 family RNA polymerase sigma factor n=1 Tax=Jeotgalibacillus sp. ET6 TaxID=3037260 RepID=UPI002418668F|nr:sigma-70 family RNA polymerase sigma factor [Jeotgalibacillus sp. ET6]MDG5470526.1 sigma-70 family RNA polymerase sigma factor [Jeotgalibacillus sp. ET6]
METWNEKLINEYNIGKRQLKHYRDSIDMNNPINENEHRIVSEMISDMNFSLEWMRKGRRPGNRRGIDHRSVYQRTALLDMDLFPSIDLKPKQVYLKEEQRRQLIDILLDFSYRERECYLLHMAQGLSYADIADELNLKRRTVQQYVERAKEKVDKKLGRTG